MASLSFTQVKPKSPLAGFAQRARPRTGLARPSRVGFRACASEARSEPDLSVTVNGLSMPNPFVIGSGPPGTNYTVMKRAFDEGWGAVIAKTVSLSCSVMIMIWLLLLGLDCDCYTLSGSPLLWCLTKDRDFFYFFNFFFQTLCFWTEMTLWWLYYVFRSQLLLLITDKPLDYDHYH